MKRSILFVFLVACGGSSPDAIGDGPVPSGYAEGREDARASAEPNEPADVDASTPDPVQPVDAGAPDVTPEPAPVDAGGTSGPVPRTGNENPGCQSYQAKIDACAGAGVQARWAVSSTCNGQPWRFWSESNAFVEFRPGGLEGCGQAGTVRCCLN